MRAAALSVEQFALVYLSGVLIGDLGCYALGFVLSKFPNFRWLRLRSWRDKHPRVGMGKMLLIARFTPALKLPVFAYAGWSRYSFARYAGILAALTFVQVAVAVVLLSLQPSQDPTRFEILWSTLLIYFTIYAFFRGGRFWLDHRGALRLHLRKEIFWLLRYHDRQYWPLWLLYVPLYFYIPWLALKHRSWWAWLHVNPGLPNGGWWGERKSDLDPILRRHLGDCYLPGEALDPVAFKVLPPEGRLARLRAFSYPLVAKPDRGKQGSGVRVARTADELETIVLEADEVLFLQKYDGSSGEAGLMFYREPRDRRLVIYSITDKKFPTVTGDGKRNFFELLLADPRARFIAPIYLRQRGEPWTLVPAAGEVVPLTHLGNHSKGALFTCGAALASKALEARLNDLLGGAEGIDFGRFDIKYEARDRLLSGNFRVIELNGAGAESTNIHDPKYGLVELYRILFRQWDLLFLLGKPEEKSFRESALLLARMLRPNSEGDRAPRGHGAENPSAPESVP